ncbi:YopX family protein [Bacillus altitudinis]|uniref:YopX family protein n=1 Tax=Bacillus altitudinis TaxID=293387 RepID=UPI00397E6585
MREIKFRGWYGSKIGMMTPTFNGDINKIFAEKDGIYMQFTGLKDRNGVDIYGGDIALDPVKNIKGVICYDSHQARYKFVPLDLYHANAGNGGWTGLELNVNRRLPEVVGNIYENPELLIEEQ